MAWTPDIVDRPGYREIVELLAQDIRSGLLAPGDRLPTQRDLADTLGVSLGTVTRAYTEARRRGLLHGEVGRGTFVTDPPAYDTRWALDATTDRTLIDLGLLAAPSIDGELEALLRRGLRDAIEGVDLDRALGYQPHAGAPAHRAAGARWMARTGLDPDPARTLVCASAQHAMTCILSVVARPGDVVMTEGLTAPGFKDLASWMQVRLHGLPADRQGLVPAAFEAACRRGVSRVLFTMPVLHNPTTVTQPEERRREIADIARRHGVAIIEDGVHGLLAGEGVTPLTAFAPETSYYFTSLSKTIAPGLRVGYIRAPRGSVSPLEDAIRATQWMASPLLAEIATAWIGDGTASRALDARREEAAARQRLLAEHLPDATYEAAPTSYHAWLSPEGWTANVFAAAARSAGVAITVGDAFLPARGHAPCRIRLSLSAAADRDELVRGLEILGELLAAPPG